jgi:hypothetical protein
MIPEVAVNELKQLVLALSEHLALRSRGNLPNSWDVLQTFWLVVNALISAKRGAYRIVPGIPRLILG